MQKDIPVFSKISFYIVAHADDWQLFMHPQVYHDLISPSCKVIFIITTAGDAGMDQEYWLSREEGSKSSIRFCMAPSGVRSELAGCRRFNDHIIDHWSANNSTSYFLRLPDGNMNGHGFAATDFQTLKKLQSKETSELTALSGSTTYQGWEDLVQTLQAIIVFESNDLSNTYLHYLNPDPDANPGDHQDHIHTGNAIENMPLADQCHRLLFTGYSTAGLDENLSPPELFLKAGMFAVYDKAVYDLCGYSTLQEQPALYTEWCCRKPVFVYKAPL